MSYPDRETVLHNEPPMEKEKNHECRKVRKVLQCMPALETFPLFKSRNTGISLNPDGVKCLCFVSASSFLHAFISLLSCFRAEYFQHGKKSLKHIFSKGGEGQASNKEGEGLTLTGICMMYEKQHNGDQKRQLSCEKNAPILRGGSGTDRGEKCGVCAHLLLFEVASSLVFWLSFGNEASQDLSITVN